MGELRGAVADLLLGSRCAGCHRPGPVLCPACEPWTRACPRLCWPEPRPPVLNRVTVAPYAGGDYADVLRRLVVAYKDDGRARLVEPLGQMLGTVVEYALQQAAPGPAVDHGVVEHGVVELVPVPSTRASLRRRGRDPVGDMARAAGRQLRRQGRQAAVVARLAHRRAVLDQAGLDAPARAANLCGALTARPPHRRHQCAQRLRVVVDDVLTTGATADESVRALVSAGWPVVAVATVAATRRRLLDTAPLPLAPAEH